MNHPIDWYCSLFSDPDKRLAAWGATLTTLTFAITFILKPSRQFILGILGSSYKKNKKLKEDFLFDVSSILKPLKEQTISIQEFIENMKADKREIGHSIIHNLKRVEEQFSVYNREELFNVFGRKTENKKAIANILGNIKLIDTQISIIEKELPKYPTTVNMEKDIYVAAIHEVCSIIQADAIGINTGTIDIQFRPFVVELVEVYNKHMEVVSEYKLLFGKESFFDPLRIVVDKYGTNNPRVVILTQLMNKAAEAYKEITVAKEDMISFSERMMQQFSELHVAIEKQYEVLKH